MKSTALDEPWRSPPAIAATLLFVLICSGGAHAQDLDLDRFSVRGFGTIAATTHDAEGIEFRRGIDQPHGVREGGFDLAADSLAGLQLNAALAPHFDAVMQAVTRMNSDGSWNPRITQGFVRYSPDEALVFRAGRFGYDIYLLAESRQVGYSYLTLRPSLEFYGMVTNDQIDGADAAITLRAGPGLATARVFGGEGASEIAFQDGTHPDTHGHALGVSFDYLYRGWTARVALLRFRFPSDPQLAPLLGALRATGSPQAAAMADSLGRAEYESRGMQLGVAYEGGPLQAQLLYGGGTSNSVAVPEFSKLYGLVGYQLHRWTPFVSYASSRDRNPVRGAGLPDIPQLAPLDAAVRSIQQSSRSTQHTVSAGVRFDLSEHVDFKMQLDRASLEDTTLVFDRRLPAGGPASMTVLAVSVDFVF
jgi:hypothetical protein